MRKWIVAGLVLALLAPASAQAKPDLPTMTLPDLKFLVGKALKRERQLDYHESSAGHDQSQETGAGKRAVA